MGWSTLVFFVAHAGFTDTELFFLVFYSKIKNKVSVLTKTFNQPLCFTSVFNVVMMKCREDHGVGVVSHSYCDVIWRGLQIFSSTPSVYLSVV